MGETNVQEFIRREGGLSSAADPGKAFDQPFLSKGQQALGKQAFETSVQPLRAGFEDRLDTTLEKLSSRGVAFGGVGRENVSDFLTQEGELEKNIAGNVATSLGQTALDQAFKVNEAAKERSLKKDLQSSEFEFEGEESALERGESALNRDFSAEENRLDRKLTSEESGFMRDFESKEAQLSRDAESGSQSAQFEQQSRLQRVDQEFQGSRLDAQQSFDAEQALLDRTLTSEESALTRDMQTSLERLRQSGAIELEQERQTGDEASLQNQQKFARDSQLVELALSGNLTGDDVGSALGEIFGPGAVMTTEDELTLQRIASASGLSVEDYEQIRSAIGTEQAAVMLSNPEEFIDDPAAAREFQKTLAEASNKHALDLVQAQTDADLEVIKAEVDSEIDVDDLERREANVRAREDSVNFVP